MNRRRAITQIELVVATVLLGATLLTITQFKQRSLRVNQATQRASFAQSRMLNVRREISTWPLDVVTAEAIAKLPIDEANFLPQARWIAEVKEIDQPIAGKQVVLAIQWQNHSQPQTCPSLTFWVKRP